VLGKKRASFLVLPEAVMYDAVVGSSTMRHAGTSLVLCLSANCFIRQPHGKKCLNDNFQRRPASTHPSGTPAFRMDSMSRSRCFRKTLGFFRRVLLIH
jgi:hypothetical protein